ncbi:tetratricopeptide repeat protein [Salimicrobium halophilum]|uniref:Tetratricopeptide repeat-containing protein n=1 Tax=Salimicrobium halophilum TaxID=86666 RepID=A0A1G8Q0Z5_9BACI|nr:tetratricopeptide repeat protein [Salimicrobium halophilum]SDI98318.1 Tetratricopeptide repeat-containing protein [Salimicrobium halophilum]
MEEIQKAVHQMEENQTEDALQTLQDYLPVADEDEKFTIAELYIQWGMLEEAKMILKEFLQQYPKEQEIIVMLAEIHIDLEEDMEAIDLLNKIQPEDEMYLQALMQVADLYQSQGLFEVSESKLLTAKHYAPNEPVIDFALGELAFSNGEYNKSIPYYENAMEHSRVIGDIEVATRLGEAYAATGGFEEALGYFQDVEEENPDVQFRYGFIANKAGRNDITIQVWEDLLKKDPYYQSVYPLLARVYEEEGMAKEALEKAQEGLKKDEFNKDLYYMVGFLSHKQGDKEAGYQAMKEAVAIDPGYKEAVLFLLENYKWDENYEDIISLLEDIQSLGEVDPLYDWELAKAYREEENFGKASEYYDRSYAPFKEDVDFLEDYGYFLVENGQATEAIAVFKEYLQLEPSNTEIEEFLERLNA